MRERIGKFMAGRYGMDQFNRFIYILGILFFLISALSKQYICYMVALVLLTICMIRTLSKNHGKRYGENLIYLKYKNRIRFFFDKQWKKIKERKIYHIYKCPNCRQKIRIPRGKGRISVACPKCRTEFIKKS